MKIKIAALLFLFFLCGDVVAERKPITVLPERLKNNRVVFVNSDEYKKVAASEINAANLAKEIKEMEKFTQDVIRQVSENEKIQSALLRDFQNAKVVIGRQTASIAKRELEIWKWRAISAGLVLVMTGYLIAKFYFRIPI